MYLHIHVKLSQKLMRAGLCILSKTVYSSLSSIICTKLKKKKSLTVVFCSAAHSVLLEFPFCILVHEVTPNVREIRKDFI